MEIRRRRGVEEIQDTTAIRDHILSTGHRASLDDFHTLDKANNLSDRPFMRIF